MLKTYVPPIRPRIIPIDSCIAQHVRKSPAPLIQNALPTWWGSESEAELAAAEYAASHLQPAQSEPKEEHKRSHSQRVAEVKTNGHGNGSANSRHKVSQNGQ